MNEKDNAAYLVASALLGFDEKAVSVAGKVYVIPAPTIRQIAGAGRYLCQNIADGFTLQDVLRELSTADALPKALSWFIKGDESLAEELSNGTYKELVHGIEVAISLMSIEPFCKLSVLKKSVGKLIAKQKP